MENSSYCSLMGSVPVKVVVCELMMYSDVIIRVSLVLRFLPVSPMFEAGQSEHLILPVVGFVPVFNVGQ